MDAVVRQLLDERDITQLCYRYGAAIDGRDWNMLRGCFTEDAVTVYEGLGQFEGYAAVEKVVRATVDPLDRSQHLIGNVTVEVDGDDATARCYLQAQHIRAGTPGGDRYLFAGRYTDRLVRTPEGWRFTRRHLEQWWVAGNPAVVGL